MRRTTAARPKLYIIRQTLQAAGGPWGRPARLKNRTPTGPPTTGGRRGRLRPTGEGHRGQEAAASDHIGDRPEVVEGEPAHGTNSFCAG